MKSVKFVLVIVLTLVSAIAFGQSYKSYLKKGNRYFKAEDYYRAITNFQKALIERAGNPKATYNLGVSYLYSDDKLQALQHIEGVYNINPKVGADIEYFLGLAYQYHNKFDEAKAAFQRYKERYKNMADVADHKIMECIIGDSLMRNARHVEVSNLGPTVNSIFNDYAPLSYNNGKSLVLTSSREGSTGEIVLSDGSYYEDVYITNKLTTIWSKPSKISSNINVIYHEAATSISPDGKTLLLYYESGGGDIYISRFEKEQWTLPTPLSDKINSLYWESSACFSPDGKTIYFSSNKPGGMGGLDLYKSEMNSDGQWQASVNLGPLVNTPDDEDAPFMHADGKTLYFGSTGHPGMGGVDIFYSELKNGKFQKPVNMGYPINTVFTDNYFIITPDKKQGYFASLRPDGIGRSDIYFVDMDPSKTPAKKVQADEKKVENGANKKAEGSPKATAPKEEVSVKYYDDMVTLQKDLGVVTLLKGKVIDASSAKPLYANVKLINNENNVMVGEVTSDPVTGKFELIIPNGGNYGVSTNRPGYLFNSINFNVPTFQEYQEVDAHILLQKVEVGSKVVLKNVFFSIGKSDLRTESLSELNRIKELLIENGSLQVQINGHTDDVGNPVYNKLLSKKRAQSVVDFLIGNGIAADRLSAIGFGKDRPLVSNDDEKDGREINRRTEIEIIGLKETLNKLDTTR